MAAMAAARSGPETVIPDAAQRRSGIQRLAECLHLDFGFTLSARPGMTA
jgi:hypothetical protein